jgi:hypothetical protein
MLKFLKYITLVLSVTATLLVLTQASLYSDKLDPVAGEQQQSTSHDEPLVVAFEQLLPPFLNNSGSGVRQVEPPANTNTNTRILTDNDDFRVAYSCGLTHRKLAQNNISTSFRLAQREQAGFYIYELCKLLI